jgi:DNA-binding response OmpR family regulator
MKIRTTILKKRIDLSRLKRDEPWTPKIGKARMQRFRDKFGRKAILVVEDETALIRFYEYAMGEDYDVFIAESGEEAFEILQTLGGVDLVLLDIKLPGISGMEVLKEIKKSCSVIPVMIVSASRLGKKARDLSALGACAYLEKPFEVCDLLDKIKIHMERSSMNPDS